MSEQAPLEETDPTTEEEDWSSYLAPGEAVNLDADPQAEAVVLDTDADSVPDTVVLDTDEDSVADTVLVDTDEDSVLDTALVDTDRDGVLDTVVDDETQDPAPDAASEVPEIDEQASGDVTPEELELAEESPEAAAAVDAAMAEEFETMEAEYGMDLS